MLLDTDWPMQVIEKKASHEASQGEALYCCFHLDTDLRLDSVLSAEQITQRKDFYLPKYTNKGATAVYALLIAEEDVSICGESDFALLKYCKNKNYIN